MSEFLPQYAAQAVIDLEWIARKAAPMADTEKRKFEVLAMRSVAAMIRAAVHIVLPVNGEVYRSNHYGGNIPNQDECESFAGLPAPVTCFEYSWTHRETQSAGSQESIAPKRITVVHDGKQTSEISDAPSGATFVANVFSVYFNERLGLWSLYPMIFAVAQPLTVISRAPSRGAWDWSVAGALRHVHEDSPRQHGDHDRLAVGEFRPDLGAVIQCCHALRAGASFDERTETSASRRWKFDKRGVGGFTYHVLKLPGGSMQQGAPTGAHDSPRFHVRRAHIRKLPTGVLTFVRQCFVGDPEKGVVGKHYKMERSA